MTRPEPAISAGKLPTRSSLLLEIDIKYINFEFDFGKAEDTFLFPLKIVKILFESTILTLSCFFFVFSFEATL